MLNLNCVICAELFAPSDDVHVTACGHMFHYPCLKQWLERSRTCPQCRNKCTERNIFRVYFNLANLDASHIDVASLQEQLDNAKLDSVTKAKELQKVEAEIKNLKNLHKRARDTVIQLEKEVAKRDLRITRYMEEMSLFKTRVEVMDTLRSELEKYKTKVQEMELVERVMKGLHDEAQLLLGESSPEQLALLVAALKRELRNSESKRKMLHQTLKASQQKERKTAEEKTVIQNKLSQAESKLNELLDKIAQTEAETTKKQKESAHFAMTHKKFEGSFDKRFSLSPSVKENLKKIEESDSPYFKIKSSSIGLIPALKNTDVGGNLYVRNGLSKNSIASATTILSNLDDKPSTSKAGFSSNWGSGKERLVGAGLRKANSDLSSKYTIFNKARLSPLKSFTKTSYNSNLVSDGCGGLVRRDPFTISDEEQEEEVNNNAAANPTHQVRQQFRLKKRKAFEEKISEPKKKKPTPIAIIDIS